MAVYDFVLRLGVSLVLGFIIGLERQFTGHPAGIRTNILICLGTCLFLQLPMVIGLDSEIARIESYIISGVGFLCSGVIFKESGNVKGLNTAATLWCSAAVGCFAATGKVYFAVMAALVLLAANVLFRPIANRIYPLANFMESDKSYAISVVCDERNEGRLRAYLINVVKDKKMYLVSLDSNDLPNDKVEITAEYTCFYRNCIPVVEQITANCLRDEDKVSAKWEQI
ncbi:MgtC/SapB family protein [Lacrimispora sp.]|uniref:MgtC/SapB family protein n=1 Tax=Lacrimispora sp. TaxID=2719234 RepID=UPI0028A59148|nr:MgtC/SapB family protein [Lacrimispora sp.]